MMKIIRTYLVMGFIVLLPAIVTLYVLQFLFTFIDRILGNFLTGILVTVGLLQASPNGKIQFLGMQLEDRIPGIGFILMILILIGVGYATKGLAGKEAIRITEKTFKKIPVARSVYSIVQQVITAFIQDRSSFKKVVLVEYPRKGLFTMGFLTGESQGEIQEKTDKECANVFLPTTPNPTSGWLVLVPKEDVILLDMSVEQGLKYIISGGVVVPRAQTYPILKQNTEEDIDEMLARLNTDHKVDPPLKVNINKKEE
jgi:uncharacterized membrane protein